MNGLESLSEAGFDVKLPANAVARLVPPRSADGETWWKVGTATWLRALPRKSVSIQQPEGSAVAWAGFRADVPGLEVDGDAAWVNDSDALIKLADDLVDGLVSQIRASVPTLPARMPGGRSSELQLDWPTGGPAFPEARRGLRMARSRELAGYIARIDAETAQAATPSTPESIAATQLLDHLSAIPRPTDTRVSLSLHEEGGLVLSWEQKGNPDLLWNAATLSWNAVSRRVEVVPRSAESAEERRRLGAFAQLLAMATAVEAATGGCSVPLRLRFSTVHSQTLLATMTVLPTEWGYDLPRLVRMVAEGDVPDTLDLSEWG